MRHSTTYIIGFAAVVCLVCSIFVSGSAVALKEKQEANKVLDRQRKVLGVAGLIEEGSKKTPAEIQQLFADNIRPKLVDIATGTELDEDPTGYVQREAAKDPATSRVAPPNNAGVQRMPNKALVYQLMRGSQVDALILPIEGKGLWSTLYGYVAVGTDGNTIKGITFYEHGETPGLGGEVDNPRWKGLWPGRKIYGADGQPAIQVIKGTAGGPDVAPFQVDGLSGATLTSRGVSKLLRFWMSKDGFGPYLDKVRAQKGGAS